jgi:hypothetical protein
MIVVIRERQEHGRAWRGLFDARKLVTPRSKFDEAKWPWKYSLIKTPKQS